MEACLTLEVDVSFSAKGMVTLGEDFVACLPALSGVAGEGDIAGVGHILLSSCVRLIE